MSKAKSGDTVQVHYTGRLDDGSTFDSSKGGDPLEFKLGSGQVIPGFEAAIIDMEPGQSKTEKIPVERAYGARHEELVFDVPREQFPPDVVPQVGMQLQGSQPGGRKIIVTVAKVQEKAVTLDANHPLAGKDLTFDITLVAIV